MSGKREAKDEHLSVYDLESRSNLTRPTLAFTPGVEKNAGGTTSSMLETPLRSKRSTTDLKCGSSFATVSEYAGQQQSSKLDRYSYSLGNGNYIVLEEVANSTPGRSRDKLVRARDLSDMKGTAASQFLQIDDDSSLRTFDARTPYRGPSESRSEMRGSPPQRNNLGSDFD